MSKQLTHQNTNWEKRTFPISILLHNFNMPVNIGSIFRLADAFGCEHIYLSGSSTTPPNRKITKTARSADKYVAYTYHDDPFEVLSDLKAKAYRVISLELTTGSRSLSELSVSKNEKLCLVFGSESEGIADEILKLSDEIVHIPMFGETSSMNVATAAGIALYQIVGQLQ